MKRRHFLAIAGGGLTTSTAGCGFVDGTVELATPAEEIDRNGREQHLVFEDDGNRVAEVSIDQRSVPRSPHDPVQLRLLISHRGSE